MKQGTLGKVVKAAAFAKAPKKTYMWLHPIRARKQATFMRGLGTYVTPGNGARLGLLAALPLAWFALRGRRN